MKKKAKLRLLLILSLTLISKQIVLSQTKNISSGGASSESASSSSTGAKYVYEYDNNGNRIHTYYHITVQSLNKSAVLETDTTYQEEGLILPNEVIFYPNPTTGFVKVNIQGFDENLVWKAWIYNSSGNEVYSTRISSSTFQFDLSTQKSGVYILRIQGGGLLNEWKIIKQ